jgi:phage terminase large subunit-like protein
MLGLRIGDNPQSVITTTPKPTKLLKEIIADPGTIKTSGTTYDNRANLAPAFFDEIIRKYEGTRLGLQELNAKILDDAEGALWNRTMLDDLRLTKHPDLFRVVVGVDPAATATADSDQTGIIAAGVAYIGDVLHGYVLDDVSLKDTPAKWAKAAVTAYYKSSADKIAAEVNNGGDMVEYTIHTVDPDIKVVKLHASRGKHTRAEPIAALYEQKRVHHVGTFGDLEDQMCNWTPGDTNSPDRMDALVWALTELMLGTENAPQLREL